MFQLIKKLPKIQCQRTNLVIISEKLIKFCKFAKVSLTVKISGLLYESIIVKVLFAFMIPGGQFMKH